MNAIVIFIDSLRWCAPEIPRRREFVAIRHPYQKQNLVITRITFRNASAGQKKAPEFLPRLFSKIKNFSEP
jgi:hypothetical protein